MKDAETCGSSDGDGISPQWTTVQVAEMEGRGEPQRAGMVLTMSPLLQSQKLRDVFNMDFPDNNFLLKTLTVVSGPDMVDLTFHNFVSYKENVGKVQ